MKGFLDSARRALVLPEGITLRRLGQLWGLCFGLLVLHARAGVLLHEFGHAAAILAAGGEVRGVSITLFGGGAVAALGPSSAFFPVAGIVVNAALGTASAAAAVFLLRRAGPPWAAQALALGAAVNLAGSTHYAVLSSFYGFGDLSGWPRIWVGALVAFAVAMPAALLLWSRTLAPLVGARFRTGVAGLIVAVVPLVLYGACLFAEQALTATRTQFVALKGEEMALARQVERVRERKLAEWREEHGSEPPPPEAIAVSVDEVKRPFPLTMTMLVFDAAFILAVLLVPWRGREGRADGDVPRVPWVNALAAGAIALLVAWLVF